MKERTFDYTKKNGEFKHYDIFVLEDKENAIVGVLKKDLNEEQKKLLQEKTEFTKEEFYGAGLAPYIRCFVKERIH